jgi:hypothetical protein
MSRVVTVNKSIKDERLTDLFAQMTGAKSAEPRIIIPKYSSVTMIKCVERFQVL